MILLLCIENYLLFKIRELQYSLTVAKPLRKYCSEPIWKVKEGNISFRENFFNLILP